MAAAAERESRVKESGASFQFLKFFGGHGSPEISREMWFFIFFDSGSDRLHSVKTSEEDPVGVWFTYPLRPCAPRSLIPGPMPATGQLGQISVCTFLCAFACKCGPPLFMCTYKARRHQVWRGRGRDQVPAESREGTHMLGCRKRLLSLGLLLWRTWAYARRHTYTLKALARTTPKKHTSHTLRSYGLKESHWGRRLNLLKRKNRCIWKMKGEGMQARVWER